MAGRHDLTDAQWAVLELLPPAGRQAGSTADMDQAAVDRWDPVADPGGRAVAGRAGTVRVLVGGLRAVSALAA
jgi:transposase